MLYRASVTDVKSGRISRNYGHIAVVMQYYPRFLSKNLISEYLRELAPERGLFTEFKTLDRELNDHNRAFEEVRYEERFALGEAGKVDLERLTGLSRQGDVYLVCQCTPLQRCHADLLMMMARRWYGASTQFARLQYPRFAERI